jgi:superfamily I DNA and/or RNA helicase
LIHGPFGTGKTRTLVELISQETRQGHKVLATAESNAAVDNVLERLMENKKLNLTRLGHPQRVSKHNVTQTLAYKVENHKLKRVELLRHECGLGHPADVIVDKMVEQNTWDVDAVSGATVSSGIIKNAVNKALR